MTTLRDDETSTNRVTVVVPIYGDWPSLKNCVQSLIDHADPEIFDVLLVNDCGPDADEIEAGVRGLIYGLANYRYARNPENLGFVRTCNRAAFELDESGNDILLLNSDTRITQGALQELRVVLHLSEHHAVVCPRSNDATIATIPFFRKAADAARSAERSHDVFEQLAQHLPRYYVAPVAIGFCFLVRRSVIDRYGLFDEIFGKGYNEENDFCLRVNALGYASVIANRAFVFHIGSANFGSDQREALEARNSQILHKRYPFYPAAVVTFIQHEYAAVDRFADLLVPTAKDPKPKVLLDLGHLNASSTESTDDLLGLIGSMTEDTETLSSSVTIAATATAIEHFALHRYGLRVIDYSAIDEVFDVGVSVPPVDVGQLTVLNRHCLRWILTGSDATRTDPWSLRVTEPQREVVTRTAIEHAESIVTISTRDHHHHEFWKRIMETGAADVDFTALQLRDRTVRDLSLVWEGLHRPFMGAKAELVALKASRTYKLARAIAAVASPARKLTGR